MIKLSLGEKSDLKNVLQIANHHLSVIIAANSSYHTHLPTPSHISVSRKMLETQFQERKTCWSESFLHALFTRGLESLSGSDVWLTTETF